MRITLRWQLGRGTARMAEYESDTDIVLGRPGGRIEPRRRKTATVIMTSGGPGAYHSGMAPVSLLDLSPDKKVSRAHARLYYELSAWWIEDLRSVNPVIRNGALLAGATELESGDTLRLGDTLVTVSLEGATRPRDEGHVDATVAAEETEPEVALGEDDRVAILARVADIVAQSASKQSLLDALLRELAVAFPRSAARSLTLVEDRELVTRAFWPPDRSRVSFTLARRAVQTRQGLHWRRAVEARGKPVPHSLQDVTAALYSPMVVGGAVIGVVHVDSTAPEAAFGMRDLVLLNSMAITIGAALREQSVTPYQTLPPLPSVFVSYAREQRSFVDRLAADLRRHRIKVWFDERLQTGERWLEQLRTAIAAADALVLVVSRDSNASEPVAWERAEAEAIGRPVLPLLFEPCDLPAGLDAIQYEDATVDYTAALGALTERIQQRDST